MTGLNALARVATSYKLDEKRRIRKNSVFCANARIRNFGRRFCSRIAEAAL